MEPQRLAGADRAERMDRPRVWSGGRESARGVWRSIRLCGPLGAATALLFGCLAVCALLVLSAEHASSALAEALALTPTVYAYLPLAVAGPYTCPLTSNNVYTPGYAIQYDLDNPVRPAVDHADKNIELRGYSPNTDPALQRELVDYGSDDATQPPQLATLFQPYRVPTLTTFYRVYNWVWQESPAPGFRGDPISTYEVTALGLGTIASEGVHVPTSGYAIGAGMEVLVLFADADTVALRYTREDSSGSAGYTVHIDNLCTDPNLLALYNQLDDPAGPRYVFHYRGYCCYDLPALPAGAPLGTACDGEIVVAVTDSGPFMDPRSCNEWWQIRPGYTGTCPWHH